MLYEGGVREKIHSWIYEIWKKLKEKYLYVDAKNLF